MSRTEFMERLEKLLWSISDSEREEALQYYNDYFDDAGPENEESVIRELVSPEQVAQKIKAGLSDTAAEFSEQGYRDTRFDGGGEPLSKRSAEQEKLKKEGGFWKILALVLLCIVLAPVILPLFIGLLAALVGIVVAVLAVVFGIAVSGIAILLSGVFVIGVGIVQAVATPAVGIALSGVGCLLTAVGVLISVLILWCAVKVVPWMIRGIVSLIRLPFKKRKAGAGK